MNCEEPGCATRASFGAPNECAKFCRLHAPSDYVRAARNYSQSKHMRCEAACCRRYASRGPFVIAGTRQYLNYCKRHAPSGYVRRGVKRCAFADCEALAIYGLRTTHGILRAPTYCIAHAPDGYENTEETRCISWTCKRHAIYRMQGSAYAQFCSIHRPHGSARVAPSRDMKSDDATSQTNPTGFSPVAIHPLAITEPDDARSCIVTQARDEFDGYGCVFSYPCV
jgi:hypothetical protein